MELKPCPFCKRKGVVSISVCDEEGNYHGELGCDYEQDPWSGLSYALAHAGWGTCLLCSDNEVMGGVLFDTADAAAEAWNGIANDSETRRIKKQLALNKLGYPYDLPNKDG